MNNMFIKSNVFKIFSVLLIYLSFFQSTSGQVKNLPTKSVNNNSMVITPAENRLIDIGRISKGKLSKGKTKKFAGSLTNIKINYKEKVKAGKISPLNNKNSSNKLPSSGERSTLVLPNLIANYTPDGWDGPIVPSNIKGTYTLGILNTDTTFIDFAFVNRDADIPSWDTFYVFMYFDGELESIWYWTGIYKDYYGHVDDYKLSVPVSPGTHELKMEVDATYSIQESNEGDNIYSATFNWIQPSNNQADIRVTNFSFSPQTLKPGDSPNDVSFDLINYGPANMTSPNSTIKANFFLSGNNTFGDGDDINIGDISADFELQSGNSNSVILTSTGLSHILIPSGTFGDYYVFVQVEHCSPSTLTDPDPSDNFAMQSSVVNITGNLAAVTTGAATEVSQTSATLNGVVNPNGISTTVQFDYGTTTNYGNTITAAQSPINGSGNVNVSANISGLNSNTTYHYRLKATNSTGTSNGGDMTFKTNINYPSSILVSKNYTFADPAKSSNYKLIGLPGNLNTQLTQLISGTPKQDWTAYYDNGNTSDYLVEYSNTSTFNFRPGNGFWIISKNAINISQNINTVTLSADNMYSIPLHGGWNIISNPFERSVDWNSVTTANNIIQNPVIYSWSNGSYQTTASFLPYEGYYFNNLQNLSSLKIPYNPQGTIGKKTSNSHASLLRLFLYEGSELKSSVTISIDSASSNDFDSQDILSPPCDFVDAGINLQNNNLSINYKNLIKECRPQSADGQIFNINVKNKSRSALTLKAEGADNFLQNEIYLQDNYNHKLYNLKENNLIGLPPVINSNYLVLIGNKEFINKKGKEILPAKYALNQNYPNPFNPATTIEYSIPGAAFVSIKVYGILGNEVATLVNEFKQAGSYIVQFSVNNLQLTSGVYFYRMKAGDFVSVKKLILIK